MGGMAEVLLGRATGIGSFERHVVIKRIRADQARDSSFVKMFLDEARLAASLHHTNILQVHDIGEEAGEYFFTMEYLHGQDLRKLMKRVAAREEQLPIEVVVAIVMNAAAGLHFAHEHRGADRQPLGIVHRDVSLSNIMVGYDGFVKVTDFGIAKAVLRSAETRSGVLKGKVAYMSPEQCLGKPVDRRSDIYSLGIVLYELATARRLFKAESDFLTMSAIVDGQIPPPSSLRADLPPELEAIIVKALARRAANRYQTADELRAALEDFALANHLRTTGTALAAYMRKLFGEQPEPWVADAPVDEPDDSDFDGSASGLVEPRSDAMRELALPSDTPAPSSPIAKARTRATTHPAQFPRAASDAVTLRSDEDGPIDAPPKRRGGWLAFGGLLAAGGAIAAVIALRSPTVTTTTEPTPAPVEPESAVGKTPTGTKPVDTKPDEAKPTADTKAAETNPATADTRSADTKRVVETKVVPEVETKPDDTKPDEPDETKLDETKLDEAHETKPDETNPDDTKPDDTTVGHAKSTEPTKPAGSTTAKKDPPKPVAKPRPVTKPAPRPPPKKPKPTDPKWDPNELIPK